MSIIRFLILLSIKFLALLFYRFDLRWVGQGPKSKSWSEVRLIIILNHTSLLEPIFAAILPIPLLWRIASQGIFPAADITMARPIVGRIFRALAPQVISLSRKRDESWQGFLEKIDPRGVVLFLPEGRMKRPTGLDKYGHPMTVRGGIVDVLELLGEGRMLVAYSGGLHHLTPVGKILPRICLRIQIALEIVEISDYVAAFRRDERVDRAAIVEDLETRRDRHCVARDARESADRE